MKPAGGTVLPASFYANPDVVEVSRLLLGKVICTRTGEFTSGIITETEAYCGRNDKACHANNGKRTGRTEVMFGDPGHAYIYLCYGIHHLFNVVTNRKGLADAVLVRSVQPLDGIETIKKRRNANRMNQLADGPGKLTQALGITTSYNATSLSRPPVWIEDRGITVPPEGVQVSPRIGIDYAEEDAELPWRFYLKEKISVETIG
ncbi:MAG: DNA-3-methyladenine glycosylase [Balneolaceae bacterium]